MKSVPFHIPNAGKRYPFRAEPPEKAFLGITHPQSCHGVWSVSICTFSLQWSDKPKILLPKVNSPGCCMLQAWEDPSNPSEAKVVQQIHCLFLTVHTWQQAKVREFVSSSMKRCLDSPMTG